MDHDAAAPTHGARPRSTSGRKTPAPSQTDDAIVQERAVTDEHRGPTAAPLRRADRRVLAEAAQRDRQDYFLRLLSAGCVELRSGSGDVKKMIVLGDKHGTAGAERGRREHPLPVSG